MRRRRLAAVVVATGMAAWSAGCGNDADQIADPTTTSTTTTVPTTATDPPETTTEPPGSPASRPAFWIGHTEEHRLVVVDAGSGEVVRVLAEFDDPATFGEETGEPFAGGSFLGAFQLSPDGDAVYYELCCEPAPGVIFRVPIDGGEPEQVAFGAFPALSPDGAQLAVVELQWVTVIDLATGDTTRFEATTSPVALANLAWSPDGTMLAVERYDEDLTAGEVVVLEPDRAPSLDDARPVASFGDDVGGTPTLPSFDDVGRVHVVYQHRDEQLDVAPPATAVVLDADDGTVVSQRALEGAVTAQDHDRTGQYLVRTIDGVVRGWTPEGEALHLGDGYHAAAW